MEFDQAESSGWERCAVQLRNGKDSFINETGWNTGTGRDNSFNYWQWLPISSNAIVKVIKSRTH